MQDIESFKRWLGELHTDTQITENSGNAIEEFDQFISYLFNSNRDGISILDKRLNIVGVNYTMERWYNDSEAIVGHKCYEVYHGRELPCEGCPTLTALETKKYATSIVPYEDEEEVKGSQELCSFPLFDDDGNVSGVIEYVRAVDDRETEEQVVETLKRRLGFQEQTLHEQEIALDVLLRRRERNERKLAESIKRNIDTLIHPLLDDLKRKADKSELARQIELLEAYVEELLSPLTHTLTSREYNLTAREIQVADLIKQGKTSKEIAGLLGTSVKAVDYHRMNVRRKLGITNTNRSLRNLLCTLDSNAGAPA